MSRLRRYRAHSIEACMRAARRDFGADAVIHAVRTRREGLLRRRVVHELLAGPASSLQSIATAGVSVRNGRGSGGSAVPGAGAGRTAATGGDVNGKSAPPLRTAIARRAYGAAPVTPPDADASAPVGGSVGADAADGAPAVPGAAELDRRRTQLLAQAMAIRHEREAQAKRTADAADAAPGTEPGADHGAASQQDGHDRPGSRGGEGRRDGGEIVRFTPEPPRVAQRFVLVPADRAEAALRGPDRDALAAFGRTGDGPAVSALAEDLRALRALVERVIASRERGDDMAIAKEFLASPAPWCDAIDAARVGGVLAGFYATLIGHSMAGDLAKRIVEEARDALPPGAWGDPGAVRGAVRNRIAAMLPPCDAATIVPHRGERPHVISLVGPTGTGKTTTIAKLAAGYALRHELRVGLVTTDTFRIGAVEQLRTYAEIVGIPFEVAKGVRGVRSACRRLADRDVILIDTAGRGHTDHERIGELARLLHAAQPDETHLVLSATGRAETLVSQAEAFSCVGADRVVVAKLDESVGFGVLLEALHRIGSPVSWITTGQHVPNDIEPARPERLAELVVDASAVVRDAAMTAGEADGAPDSGDEAAEVAVTPEK